MIEDSIQTPTKPRPGQPRWRLSLRRALATCSGTCLLLAAPLAGSSAGDLQTQIAAGRATTAQQQRQIAADTVRIGRTAAGVRAAEAHLSRLQGQLQRSALALHAVQTRELAARNHLVDLENFLARAARSLAANLVARYEDGAPNLMTVILSAHGFSQLLEQVDFAQRIGHQDAQIIAFTRRARVAVQRQAVALAALEARDLSLTRQLVAQRDQVAALQSALLTQQIRQLRTRGADQAHLQTLQGRLGVLEARAAAEARAEAAARTAAAAAAARAASASTPASGGPGQPLNVAQQSVGGIAVNTGGMVQAPAGAPAAVREVIAAGNAIATLPYIYGGGHASFHADGYDCSGSVSYALAAAGLVSSPMVSGDYESWGEPGPGRWITVYANAGHVWMEVAGWRFDTVAQGVTGSRWAQGGGEFAGFVVRHPAGL